MRKLNQLKIKEIYEIDEQPPIIALQEDKFTKVIRLFAASSELRGIFVTDRGGQFTGVITRSDLLDWARVQVGDYFGEGGQSPEKTLRLGKIIRATTVGEIMKPNSVMAALRLDDTARDAMRKMVELNIIVLPVVNESNQIVGDVKLSEILAASLEEK